MRPNVRAKPMNGALRTWSDGRCVHLLVRFTGGRLGKSPVTMHATTDLVPARAAVRQRFVSAGNYDVAGDPVTVEALATRVGLFSAFRRIGRAAKGAASLATAPVRALGGAGVNVLKTTTNLAKGVESTTALAEFATRPLGWRPGKKRGGSKPATAAPPPDSDSQSDAQANQPEEEEPMNDETSGNPKPQADQVRKASSLLNRARFSPKSARHVQNIAVAAAKGHPGAQLAAAAIAEARKGGQKPAVPRPGPAAPPVALALQSAIHSKAFTSWSRGAA